MRAVRRGAAADGDAVICSYECTFCGRAGRARGRLSELRRRARSAAEAGGGDVSGARHLYVHLPFCAHRCGYCDFVTVVGRRDEHGRYVDALLAELALERDALAPRARDDLPRRRDADVHRAGRARAAARRAARRGRGDGRGESRDGHARAGRASATKPCQPCVDRRTNLQHRTFWTCSSAVARPDDVRRAVHVLRDAGFDNISLDLIYGIPGQSAADLERDLAEALALEPEHLSAYELEAKPGTRFTHAHGAELERQAESMESYFELVVETLTAAGYRWYETANFCRARRAGATGATCGRGTTSATGSDTTTSASAWARSAQSRTGAGGTHRRSRGYLEALEAGARPPRERRGARAARRARPERVMLGLRLDEPLRARGPRARARRATGSRGSQRLGLAERRGGDARALTRARPLPRRRRHRARCSPSVAAIGPRRRRAGAARPAAVARPPAAEVRASRAVAYHGTR